MEAPEHGIVSMGRAIREGSFPVCARFTHYLDFRDADDIIGVTDLADEGCAKDIVPCGYGSVLGGIPFTSFGDFAGCPVVAEGGAHTLVLAGLRDGWAARADTLVVEPDAILFDGLEFARDERRMYRDSVDSGAFAALPPAEKGHRLAVFRDVLLAHADPLSMAVVLAPARREHFEGSLAQAMCDRFFDGVALCAAGDYAGAAGLLQGAGYGLTPSGDDFLCGVILALHFAGTPERAPRLDLSRSAGMSRTFLRDALAGRWPKRLRDAAESLGGSAAAGSVEDGIRQAVARALDHGATSGADLLSGFLHTLLRLCA
jgi:hypothetical protein